ncbi:hypothetical protein ACFVP8_21430 [Viridibacillus arvi]
MKVMILDPAGQIGKILTEGRFVKECRYKDFSETKKLNSGGK